MASISINLKISRENEGLGQRWETLQVSGRPDEPYVALVEQAANELGISTNGGGLPFIDYYDPEFGVRFTLCIAPEISLADVLAILGKMLPPVRQHFRPDALGAAGAVTSHSFPNMYFPTYGWPSKCGATARSFLGHGNLACADTSRTFAGCQRIGLELGRWMTRSGRRFSRAGNGPRASCATCSP